MSCGLGTSQWLLVIGIQYSSQPDSGHSALHRGETLFGSPMIIRLHKVLHSSPPLSKVLLVATKHSLDNHWQLQVITQTNTQTTLRVSAEDFYDYLKTLF